MTFNPIVCICCRSRGAGRRTCRAGGVKTRTIDDRRVLLVALTALAAASCSTPISSPPARPPDFDSSDYRSVRAKSDIPTVVLNLFSSLCGDCPLADVEAPFSATDFASSDLPTRRLVAAGVFHDRWFLEYEHGGRGLHRHFVLFEVRDAKATCIWANGPPPDGCRTVSYTHLTLPTNREV